MYLCILSAFVGNWFNHVNRNWISLDWFKGKSEPETHRFLPSNWLGIPVNFVIIQFYEDSVSQCNRPSKGDGPNFIGQCNHQGRRVEASRRVSRDDDERT